MLEGVSQTLILLKGKVVLWGLLTPARAPGSVLLPIVDAALVCSGSMILGSNFMQNP